VDHRRTVHFADGTTAPRALLTEIRYPALGRPGSGDVRDAPPARAAGPFPLVIFGHGFGVTPGTYAALMRAWVRAGYVVAAPLFPGENPRAPGGPTANDLPSEPGDISFVITSMLDSSRSPASVFHGLIDGGTIAVSGHSDGGDSALAVAYDARMRDRRIGAAMILSGATIPQLGAFAFPAHGPPLLATQGSADPINLPSATSAFFTVARRPKYLLTLIGAQHLPPYTTQQPQLGIIERVTLAFLAYYFDGRQPGARRALLAAGHVSGLATLQADP
jgi:predicted dienelactone hydrolase